MSRRKFRQQPPHDALQRVQRFLSEHQETDPHVLRMRKACHKYELKLRRGQGNARTDGRLDEQAERYAETAARAEARRVQVRQVLYSLGVAQCDVFNYLGFAAHIGKLKRDFSGQSLVNRAAEAVFRWSARGLDSDVLQMLLKEVFDIARPEGP